MAINIKKLDNRTNEILFKYGEQEMQVVYRPAAVCKKEFYEKLEAITDAKESILFQLQTGIVSWEMVDEDGQELPPSLELIQAVEDPFWLSLIRAINDDIRERSGLKKA